jgi:hypothetical protein
VTWTEETTDAGRQWEEDFARSIGGRLQPGSGNTRLAKLDVRGNEILWWLRQSKGGSYRLTPDDVDEAITGARGLGGPGVVPGMAIRVGRHDVVVMLAADLIDVLQRPGEFALKERKSDTRRREAAATVLSRKDDDGTPSNDGGGGADV